PRLPRSRRPRAVRGPSATLRSCARACRASRAAPRAAAARTPNPQIPRRRPTVRCPWRMALRSTPALRHRPRTPKRLRHGEPGLYRSRSFQRPFEGGSVTALSTEAANFGWLLDNFVRTVPGTRHTLVVSADGLLMAMSEQLDRTNGDQLAAIVAGLSSLTRGASRQLRAGEVRQAITEMDNWFLFLMRVSNGTVPAAVAGSNWDVRLLR